MLGQLLGQSDDEQVGFDLTPMIDVTFLLIIFWMVVTSVTPSEPVRKLELPSASVTRSAGAGRPLMMEVTPEPVQPIHFQGRAYSLGELDEHLERFPLGGREVVLRADRRTSADLVSRLARVCHRRGASSVAFSLRTGGGT